MAPTRNSSSSSSNSVIRTTTKNNNSSSSKSSQRCTDTLKHMQTLTQLKLMDEHCAAAAERAKQLTNVYVRPRRHRRRRPHLDEVVVVVLMLMLVLVLISLTLTRCQPVSKVSKVSLFVPLCWVVLCCAECIWPWWWWWWLQTCSSTHFPFLSFTGHRLHKQKVDLLACSFLQPASQFFCSAQFSAFPLGWRWNWNRNRSS